MCKSVRNNVRRREVRISSKINTSNKNAVLSRLHCKLISQNNLDCGAKFVWILILNAFSILSKSIYDLV